jgi:hypothetical protein
MNSVVTYFILFLTIYSSISARGVSKEVDNKSGRSLEEGSSDNLMGEMMSRDNSLLNDAKFDTSGIPGGLPIIFELIHLM